MNRKTQSEHSKTSNIEKTSTKHTDAHFEYASEFFSPSIATSDTVHYVRSVSLSYHNSQETFFFSFQLNLHSVTFIDRVVFDRVAFISLGSIEANDIIGVRRKRGVPVSVKVSKRLIRASYQRTIHVPC